MWKKDPYKNVSLLLVTSEPKMVENRGGRIILTQNFMREGISLANYVRNSMFALRYFGNFHYRNACWLSFSPY